jgi:hypothetical protein
MTTIIIAGVFTIIGAIIGGLISHYGVPNGPWFLPTRKIVVQGTAKEINVSGQLQGFSDRQKLVFEFKPGTLF